MKIFLSNISLTASFHFRERDEKKSKKLSRSLTFCSILPLTAKKGKLKINKFESSNKLKCVEENSELTSFCDSLKRKTTFKEKMLNKNTVTQENMRRLSMVCDEIDRFEREFVDPVRLSSSSLSLATSCHTTRPARLRKHHSTTVCPQPSQLEKMKKKYFSTDSVTSGYDSGAFSRESTPDLSLSSSLTESQCDSAAVSEANNNITEETRDTDHSEAVMKFDAESVKSVETNLLSKTNLISSTPRKPLRCQSERVVGDSPRVATVRRSHTTSLSHPESMSKRFPATVSRAACSPDCKAKVTVNGFCYH